MLGPANCTANVTLTPPTTEVPTGTVCIFCSNSTTTGGTEPEFQLDSRELNSSSEGRVEEGVLVVYDTESVFSSADSSTDTFLNCTSDGNSTVSMVLVESKLYIFQQ